MHLKETSPPWKLPQFCLYPLLPIATEKGAKVCGGILTHQEFVHSVPLKTDKAFPCLSLYASNKQGRPNTGWAFSMHVYDKYRH